MNNVLEIKDLYFSYDNQKNILENLNLSVNHGEFIAIIGKNGAGKSTLFKLVMGNLKPNKGTIKLFDETFNKKKHYPKIAYISQNSVVNYKNFPTNILEVVSIHSKHLKKKVNITELLKMVGLENEAKKQLCELSGGQLQRVGILLALLKDAKLILLDEPTTGIDQEFSKEFYEKLSELKNMGKTVIMITHQLSEAIAYVDRVYCIECGHCVEKTHGIEELS